MSNEDRIARVKEVQRGIAWALSEIEQLTKERDEARAEIQRRWQEPGNAAAEIHRLRGALQKIADMSGSALSHATLLLLEECVAIARAALAQAADGGKANL